jgi:cysteine desulfurase
MIPFEPRRALGRRPGAPLIYLDNHATTPVDPRVLDAMLPYFRERFGNASSRSHRFGWEAEEAVEKARAQVAQLVGADPREIVFTSGASEANNLALKGAAARRPAAKAHILASPVEHPSVRDTVEHLAKGGAEVTWLPVDAEGRVRPEDVARSLTPRTFLVTVMTANNEVGAVQPVAEIGRIAKERGILFHTDATQGVGKVPFDVRALGVHLASLTAHKIFGPKGCGALYVRQGTELERQTHGGGQERGLRSGTLNVPGIVGLGMACELCRLEGEEESRRLALLRDRLERGLAPAEVRVNGPREHRLPNNLHVSFPGIDAEGLMLAVPEVAVSSGSACASGSMEISHVLKAMGMRPDLARGSVRFGLGRFTTGAEVDRAAELFVAAYRQLRSVARR